MSAVSERGAPGRAAPFDRPVARAATGSHADFEELYAAHFTGLTLQINAYVNNLNEAQDLVQEAFTRAIARWDKIKKYEDPATWVRRVAWNLATSRWRRQRTPRARSWPARRYRRGTGDRDAPQAGARRVQPIASGATATVTFTLSADASTVAGPGTFDLQGAGENLIQIRIGDQALAVQPKLGKLVVK